VSRWIRVSEQLPPTGLSVIVANDGDRRARVGFLRDMTRRGKGAAPWCGADFRVMRAPDKWQHLPAVDDDAEAAE